MILCFEEESIKEIYEIILNNFMFLACHPNGLCVTKKVISCSRNQQYIEAVQKILIENANTLVQNQHGNYSIQVALESWDYDLIHPLILLFNNQFFNLSLQKFSSNVVEKCLERGGDNLLSKFLEEIGHKTKIVELIKNSYGNYVIQKALKLASGYQKGKLTGIIKKHLEKLHDKKLISKWKNILSNICGNTLTLAQPNRIKKNTNYSNMSNDSNMSSGSLNNSVDSASGHSNYSNRSGGSNHSYTSVNSCHSYNPSMSNFMYVNMNLNPINFKNNNNMGNNMNLNNINNFNNLNNFNMGNSITTNNINNMNNFNNNINGNMMMHPMNMSPMNNLNNNMQVFTNPYFMPNVPRGFSTESNSPISNSNP